MQTVRRRVDSELIDEFFLNTDDSTPDFILASFTDWLFEYLCGGARFVDGQTLQYGYTLFKCAVQSRSLRLLAPDFQGIPMKWSNNLGPAFRIIAAHKYIPETFGWTPDIPSLCNTAIIGRRFNDIPMFANRLPPVDSNPNDSGWFIGSTRDDIDNNDPDGLKLMSLYESMLAVPHVLHFLSLPVGCQVVFLVEKPIILKDGKQLEIPKGSYLERFLEKQS